MSPLHMNKVKALRKLRAKIKRKLGKNSVWFWPRGGDNDWPKGVAGYEGTGRIVFIGPRPCCPKSKKEQEKRFIQGRATRFTKHFYETLKKLRLGNAHLTDVFKELGEAKPSKRGLEDSESKEIDFLKEELEIIKPRVTVALGKDAREWLKNYENRIDGYQKYRWEGVWHYNYPVYRPTKNQKWIKQIKDIKNHYAHK